MLHAPASTNTDSTPPPSPDPPLGPFALADALLKNPASVVRALREGPLLPRLATIHAVALVGVGLVMGSFHGGAQLLLVPLKLVIGAFFCALICLPSLHVFSCLAGARQSVRETAGALLMGTSRMAILLVGFAPIAWIFAQATTSDAFIGGLEIVFFVVSCFFGLSLVKRALAAMNESELRGMGAWNALFVVVAFQMTTALRPLVGAADGAVLHERVFFVAHWIRSL